MRGRLLAPRPRAAASVARNLVLVLVLVTMLVRNLPSAPLRHVADRALVPIVNGIGIEQNWAVFAPDPPTVEVLLEARVASGGVDAVVWRPPSGRGLLGAQRAARWAKYAEFAGSEQRGDLLLRPLARWLAVSQGNLAEGPVRVELLRRFRALSPDRPPGPERTFVFYVLELASDGTVLHEERHG